MKKCRNCKLGIGYFSQFDLVIGRQNRKSEWNTF